MTEVLNSEEFADISPEDIISQQKTLIAVLKEEILRLQTRTHQLEEDLIDNEKLYNKALDEIDTLTQKVDALKQNNESLLQTLQVFQREFVKRDYKNALTVSSNNQVLTSDAPFFMELIRIMKTKFVEPALAEIKIDEKSYLSEYYGFFFHSEVEESEAELYSEAHEAKKVRVSKIRTFGKKNFFNEKFRHFFWFNISENPLNITYRLYEILLDRLEGNRENLNRTTNIIDLDLRRMDLKLDCDRSNSMKVEIKKCLELFAMYRPDIGYVQGMSYLAWMLLIRMEGYQAFSCFANKVLCDPFVNSLYMFKEENIRKIIKFNEECLMDKKPRLAKHMRKMQVDHELFIIEWAYTFYSRAFSLRITSKIWDLWFSEGFNAFFKVSMVIMEMLEGEIMEQMENDRIIEIIRTKTHKLDEAEFIKILCKQKLYEDLKL